MILCHDLSVILDFQAKCIPNGATLEIINIYFPVIICGALLHNIPKCVKPQEIQRILILITTPVAAYPFALTYDMDLYNILKCEKCSNIIVYA